ncbi:hypothetical protein Tco_0451767 [Tanacetum coccineum]
MSKVLQERGFGSLPSSTEANPRDQVKSISTTIEAGSYPIRHSHSKSLKWLTTGRKKRDHIDHNSLKLTLKLHISITPYGDFTLPFFLNNVAFIMPLVKLGASIRHCKYPKGISENVLVGLHASLRERMELDLEVRLMGETLVINRSLDPLNGDYIELNDMNEPFELRRTQGDDFMPTIEEVLENMDAYRDEGMGDVIFGEPFLNKVGINARRFEGMITIYNGNKSVTYQIVRSHPRFKYHTNEQCNKIPPLLKVSEEDKMNGILHSYQKLKGFYKGVLNLGPDYIRDAKTKEWLTCGHISVHEME